VSIGRNGFVCQGKQTQMLEYFLDLTAIALARPPSASPQANAGRAHARQAGAKRAKFMV